MRYNTGMLLGILKKYGGGRGEEREGREREGGGGERRYEETLTTEKILKTTENFMIKLLRNVQRRTRKFMKEHWY